MCYITATELKNNLGHYLELSKTEDVYITKNNKVISLLSNPRDKAYEEFFALEGIFKGKIDENVDFDELIGEEIMRRCGF